MINHYNHSFLSDHTQNYSVCLGTEVLILLDSKVETSHVHLKLFHLKKGFLGPGIWHSSTVPAWQMQGPEFDSLYLPLPKDFLISKESN